MAKENTVATIRARVEDREKLNQLNRELSAIQKETIKTPETMRRILAIPNLKDVLINDAELKRRLKI